MTITIDQYEANARQGVYGQGIDMDGQYGYQCWDQVAHYAREVCGSPSYPWIGTYTGLAKDIYLHFYDTINPNFFTLIANEHGNPDQLPQRGDIIVANGNAGHTATVLGADGNGITLLEQWGLTPDVGFQIVTRSWASLDWLGWLRPKIDVNARVNAPDERTVTPGSAANARMGAGRSFAIDASKNIAAGDFGKFKGFERGETVTSDGFTSDIWLIGFYSERRFWLGSFTQKDTKGLADLTVTPTNPNPQPEPVVWPEYKFDAFSPVIDRVVPAHPSNFQLGRFPTDPLKVVLHDFGTRGLNTFESVENYFTTDHTNDEPHQVSAHVVIGWNFELDKAEAIEMVSVKNGDRAWGSGPDGNDFYQLEIDPLAGSPLAEDRDKKEAIIAKTREVLEALRDFKGRVHERIKHSSIMQTSCGDDIDLRRYVIGDFDPTEPVEVPDPENPGEDEPTEPPIVITDPEDPTEPTDPTGPIVIPDPVVPVTPEQEQAAANLLWQFINGKLLTGDAVLARIRTFVPIAMGPVLAFAASRIPAVFDFLATISPDWKIYLYSGLSAALGYGWWALAKLLGKRWPIAERIMLGSSKTPVYIDTINKKESAK